MAALAAVALPVVAGAQSSSINTYSPYTFYGLGDLQSRGPVNLRTMGGVSAGYRAYNVTGGMINFANPASLSALPRKTFHFNMGLEGGNFFLKEGARKTSYNTFNISDVSFAMPITSKLGLGVSLSPYSSVGYRVTMSETDENILAGLYGGGAIGAEHIYSGSGDVTQGRLSLGWSPLKRLSVGVDMLYDFGKIERLYSMSIIMRDPSATYNNIGVGQTERVSRIMWDFGVQYNILEAERRVLTFGAVYTPAARLNPEISTVVSNGTGLAQLLQNRGLPDDFKLPTSISAGLFYQTWRLGAGVDYEYRGWASDNSGATFASPDGMRVALRNTSAVKAGVEFTPARYDVRRMMMRWTYRAGVRYSDYYLSFGGKNVSEKAVTVGLGIPFKASGHSYLDLGLELGQRGGTGLIRENYFKVSVGFRLLGEGWFQKLMYR